MSHTGKYKNGNTNGMINVEKSETGVRINAYDYHTTLQELFEDVVERYPENSAVHVADETMTYSELNQAANKVAHYLIGRGLEQGQIVGITAERSFEMIIGIYGILKAGGAYLPLAYTDPVERISTLLDDADPPFVLTHQSIYNKVDHIDTEILIIEDILNSDASVKNPELNASPEDLAYVIYTSGSTGAPKGVMVPHSAVVNRLKWMQKDYPIDQNDVLLQKTPFTFDVSVWELFWWGQQGASVCMLPQNAEKNPQAIVNTIDEYQVTVIHFVPSMFNMFLQYLGLVENVDKLEGLRLVFTSGEALKSGHVKLFNKLLQRKFQTKLVNLYGPTEATVDVTHYLCPAHVSGEEIPIGKPIDNVKIYIIKDNQIVDQGEIGELCIQGAGVAMGYLNRLDLTNQKFARHPTIPNEVIYRTGDLACVNKDGNIVYHGRMDHQVKIRGIRIELGEIESILGKHEKVKDVAVLLHAPSETVSLLIAYYVADDAVTAEEFKSLANEYLPAYMIPNFFHRIPYMPLTPHGKADRKILPNFSPIN